MNICGVPFEIETLSDFLVLPTACSYYFWLIIFGFLFLFLTYTFYEKDEQKRSEGEMLSSMGVSSIAVTALALWGSFVKSTQGVPMIQTDILLWVLAPTVVFVTIWLYSK